jgi:hypothetical protein
VSLAGLAFGQVWLVSAAFGLTLLGAGIVRVSFRRGKTPSDA